MKLFALQLILFFNCFVAPAQKDHFNLAIGFGPSYFFNDNTLNRYIDRTELIGLNYLISNKSQNISFNPGINFQTSEYHARMHEKGLVHVNQNVVNLSLDVLMKISRKSMLRVGLLFNSVYYSSLFITRNDLNGKRYYGYSNNLLYNEYSAERWQAGLSLGTSFAFKLFRRDQKFNIRLVEIVSPLVTSDFYLSKALAGEDIKVLSVKARPTMLIVGVDLNLIRMEKKKTEEE
jgi:hypothetical protein